VSKRIALLIVVVLAVAGIAGSAATAASKSTKSSHLLIGINDEANTLYGDPASAFTALKTLKTQVLRVNLYWGGTKWAVANTSRPTDPTDPGDHAYNWALYDRLVKYAQTYNIQLVLSIVFTPAWANGGKARNYPPTNFKDLENFAYAAAERYSGLWIPPAWQQNPSLGIGNTALPKVSMWTAWNEPNSPVYLLPQYKKVGKTYRVESAFSYAKICNAVMAGVHSQYLGPLAGEQVACGVTDPKGANNPKAKSRQSVDPLTFFTQAHRFGMKDFDVYAHHPYANSGKQSPSYVPKGKEKNQIQLGNINKLLAAISRYYGPKHLWITEYGYQTNPPDKTIFGVPWTTQAKYMSQAVAIARKNPRIDMFLWFQVRDEPNLGGWQSGLMTLQGKKKPSWNAFIKLPRG
jgi:hypothetical protein